MTNTDSTNSFRCPFQIKGEKNGTIIEIVFNEDAETRLKLISLAFKKFHEDISIISIRFTLPSSLLERCSTLLQLKAEIVPYQAEILAAEIDYRLDPFMPYQITQYSKEVLQPIFEKTQYKFATANLVSKVIGGHGFSLKNMSDVAMWLQVMMLHAMMHGVKNPHFYFDDDKALRYLTIAPGSIIFHPEDYEEITGPGKNNRNCFGVVLNPFYPKEFGRYSETIQIVISRMSDFTSLPVEQRRKIRYKCNLVYQQHGVKIDNLEEDKQPEGVWIPEYIK